MPRANLSDLIRSWDGLAVISRFDRPSGAWIFIAFHDDTLGRPMGGTRMNTYPDPADALLDAMRLGEAMTMKWAAIGFPYGGGKAVLAVPGRLDGEVRRGLLRRYGSLLGSLQGAFSTGVDLGTTPADMAVVRGQAPYVHGFTQGGDPIDPGPFTARGVAEGMGAALEAVFGSADAADRTILIQGVGDVGEPLARSLAAAGARLLLSDAHGEKARRLTGELGGEAVTVEEVPSTRCDVYAPCAVGAVLNARTIPELRCRIVAGSANAQLEEPGDAERLRARGILYTPDYILNAGGAMAFGLLAEGVTDEAELFRQVTRIGDSLRAIFREAAERDESPLYAAERRARRALDRGAAPGEAGAGA